jgi:hypothetical protein
LSREFARLVANGFQNWFSFGLRSEVDACTCWIFSLHRFLLYVLSFFQL